MRKQLLEFVSAAALWLVTLDATASCFPMHYYRCVGDSSSDPYVTDADIPTAITNAVCPNTVITITHERPSALTGVALEINGKSNLTLVGLPPGANCNSAPPTCELGVGCHGGGGPLPPQVALYGTNADSVLYIHGNSSVTLESLQLYGGSATYGGGIHFTGIGSLTLIETTVYANGATYGGGIQFNGSGGDAVLTLGAGAQIQSNGATDGGGIHINGTALLNALSPYTLIINNSASSSSGHGGGIEVVDPAQANIGSPGYSGAPVIEFNKAAYGGGISIDGNASGSFAGAAVRLFTTDPHNPVQVSNNTASHTGGGVYLGPKFLGAPPTLCGFDFHIDNNIAQEGTAIYADEDYDTFTDDFIGGTIQLNRVLQGDVCSTPQTIAELGGVACAADTPCNTINGNVAEDADSNPTAGSAILGQTDGFLQLNRFVMRDNHGAHAIRSFGPDPAYGRPGLISNCLIADNTLTAEMIRIDDDGYGEGGTKIDGCTIVNNENEGAPVIYSAHAFTLTNSIIDELSINTMNYVGPSGGLNVSNVLATDISSLPSAAGIDQGEPLYVDAANSDYHLQPTSIGLDFAPASGGADLDGNPRDVDLTAVPNNYGPRDIGAYERQNMFQCGTSDSIFCNGYEYSW